MCDAVEAPPAPPKLELGLVSLLPHEQPDQLAVATVSAKLARPARKMNARST
jgi:hypothetical protein